MPHFRSRYLQQQIKKDIAWSSVIPILGMRQVGKTTLLRQLGCSYFTLDDDEILKRFEQGVWGEIESAAAPLIPGLLLR